MMQIWKRLIETIAQMIGITKQEDNTVFHLEREKSSSYRMSKANGEERQKVLTQVLQPAYTRRLKPEQDDAILPEPTELSWYGLTDTGVVRPHNEDNFACFDFSEGTLFVVADGMGGHDAGEVASKIAVDVVCQAVQKGLQENREGKTLVQHAVQQANAAVRWEGANKGTNMGTTLSVAYVTGNNAYIANVGDSRVYWIENGSLRQVTEDHSLVGKMVAAGKLTKEEARKHPKSNLLYRTIGTDDLVKVDTFQVGLKKGGNLLLCSDGLWGEVSDSDIHQIFAEGKDLKKTCAKLVKTANDNGGMDNITALVARVS
jgi:protein phosphatase